MLPLIDKQEYKKLLPLAIPVLIAQLSQMAMGLVDTVMAARVSKTDMAGVAVGGSIWTPIILFGTGILMVLGPIVAHLHGGGKNNRIFHYMNQGFWIALCLSILVMVALANTTPILHMVCKDPELVPIAEGYIYTILWGAPAFLGFVFLRSLNEGISLTKPAMFIGISGLLLNIPTNYIFVYGKFGVPALGGVGCGVATAIVYWFMFLLMLCFVLFNKRHKFYRTLTFPYLPSAAPLFSVLKIGVPIALALVCEVGLFAVSALMIAPLGTNEVAAHQIAINISSLIFMIPLALGTAVSIRVAHNLGAGDLRAVQGVSRTGYIITWICALVAMIMIFLSRHFIAGCYTKDDPELTAAAASLLVYCALYQLSDSSQLMSNSILRGHKDTFFLMLITFTSYWMIAMPVGYILARTDYIVPHMGAAGFWIGFITGLTIAAILLSLRIRRIRRGWPKYIPL